MDRRSDTALSTNGLPTATSTDALQQQLDRLQMLGAEGFEPLRLDYIRSLIKRASNKPAAIADRLQQKATAALQDYSQAFDRACAAAERRADRLGQQHPDDKTHIQQLLNTGQFDALQRLDAQLNAGQQDPAAAETPFNALLDLLNQASTGDQQTTATTLEQLLRQQEQTSMAQWLGQPDNTAADDATTAPTELNAIRLFRESFERQNATRLVNQSIRQGPQDPGPLNPHQLAIRSLTAMRDLSPDYLARFVAVMDTLFWLETVEHKLDSQKKKSPTANKRSK
ncbi:Uncharacterised protein [BD1-7 clade bacterium]|uniref:DUF2894 domain-containing protein n=1 Tax=BD1-7 clade bacterium TaxID=2029982 RepID=A0A5S9MRQ3_9GAMM|nr:Uncharacterised protein [BD1-7 clade bacterium]